MKILKFLEDKDISSRLDKEQLLEIAKDCALEYTIDKESRKAWEDTMEEALSFAKQVLKPKNYPWEGAANVVFPIITVAATTFASRTTSEIIQDQKIVKIGINGEDPDGSKSAKANRVATHMAYQLLIESDTWESDLDKLLHILPLVGVCYRKTYYDPILQRPQSDFCNPKDIIVNHNVASLESADRITHRFFCNMNYIVSRIRSGHFNDKFELESLKPVSSFEDRMITDPDDNSLDSYPGHENSEVFELFEQHKFLDLDEDGYKEPYIVVFHKDSSQVLGIYPRYDINSIRFNAKNDIEYIKPDQYFVDFHFLPSPDGGFHSLGYGHLLFPLNKAINTLLNQLIDSGTLANSQSGLIGRQLKIKGGNLKMQMGELLPVDAGTTGRMQDNVFLFPFKEPSPILFQLAGLLIESCKEIASINDVLTGKAPPQNSPASTVFELSSNGLKLYSNIAKRVYRSLKKEYKMLYTLNGKYLDPQAYMEFFDSQEANVEDYRDAKLDISPVADPNMAADMQRLANSQAISLLSQNPLIAQALNVPALVEQFLESLRIPKEMIQKIIIPPDAPKPPDPAMLKLQLDQQKIQMNHEVEQMKVQLEATKVENDKLKLFIKSNEADAKVHKMNADATQKLVEAEMDTKFKDRELDIQEKQLYLQDKKIKADMVKAHMTTQSRKQQSKK